MNIRTAGGGNVEVRTFSLENPNSALSGENLLRIVQAGQESWTGRQVTPTSSLQTVAVYACVKLIANQIATLPLKLYRRVDARNKQVIDPDGTDLSFGLLARMLGQTPNPEVPAQEFLRDLVGHQLLWGNSYTNVVRNGAGRPMELWPLRPDRMQIVRVISELERELGYIYTLPNGDRIALDAADVMHIRNLSIDGVVGLSPIADVARNAVAIEQAASEHGGRFFSNGAAPSSVLTIPAKGDKFQEKVKLYRDQFGAIYGGLSKAGRMAVVEEGVTWQSIGIPNQQSQFLETRHFQVAEIARLYGVPPHMISDVERTTSWGTGIVEQNVAFLTYTLRPILENIEAAINHNLGLIPGRRTLRDESVYPQFSVEGLLRGDATAQANMLAVLIQNQVLSPEDVAGILDYPYNPDRPNTYENPNTSANGAHDHPPGDSLTPPQGSA